MNETGSTKGTRQNGTVRWHVFSDQASLLQAAMDRITEAARDAIAQRGKFSMVLAGGTTPAALYRALADAGLDWSDWHLYYGDERCLPVNDAERNNVMVARNWLDRVSTPPEVFVIPAESGPEQAAAAYTQTVQDALPFDLVLLGAGEDGHTASLFPGHQNPAHELVHAVNDAPKPPPERVSLGYAALNTSPQVLFLVTGKGKADMVRRWREGADLPVNRVTGTLGTDIYLDDQAAAGSSIGT